MINDKIKIEIEIIRGFVAIIRVNSPSVVTSIFPDLLTIYKIVVLLN